MNGEDKVFIRSDLNQCGSKVAFYRLTKELKDFLNLCYEKHGEIEGVILTTEDGEYDTNIGFILKND